MTTSHRPQLEARSGAKGAAYVPTGTQHARLLPGHTKLKLRSKRPETEIQIDEIEPKEEPEDGESEENDNSENEGSDEDQEALLQELNKIRQERMMAKRKQELESILKKEDDTHSLPPVAERSWRTNTTFGRKKVNKPAGTQSGTAAKGYKNDITKSEYHQDFLRRFVK